MRDRPGAFPGRMGFRIDLVQMVQTTDSFHGVEHTRNKSNGEH